MTDQLREALDELFTIKRDQWDEDWDAQEVNPQLLRKVIEAARAWLEFPTDEQVEAAAINMHSRSCPGHRHFCPDKNPDHWTIWLGDARAALEAAHNTGEEEDDHDVRIVYDNTLYNPDHTNRKDEAP